MIPRHLERIDWRPNTTRPPDLDAWPYTVPCVAELIRKGGLDVPPGITFLVGENGSGKSTLIEAIADLYPQGGHRNQSGSVVGPA